MKNFTFATIAAVVVAALSTGLLTIGARSPYTHGNLTPQFDPGYIRTEQTLVGSAGTYHGPGLVAPFPSTADLEARGRALLVARGCASCHGVEGRGGAVGPPIIGFDPGDLRAKTDKGPGGMPAYQPGALTDEDLEAIAAYLKSLAK